ncbi:MAG: chemotaxis protein CheB [Selenomonadaceae bacterium]|nr:chemotaxis protein CheB [Selenomonadaceae bacterium]
MEALQVAREIASSIAKSRNIETATDSPPPKGSVDLIAIGSSTGGTEALSAILKELHPPLPPIVIAQHIPALFAKLFAERLNDECRLTVQEGEEGLTVKNNNVYIAPGNFHMTVNRESGLIVTHLNTGPKVHSCRPSVDVLFDSVAAFIGKSALGIILTGMGQDGAQGLLKMRKEGSYTLGQDKNTCVVYGMPRAAFDLGAVAKQLPLTAIAGAIEEIAGL